MTILYRLMYALLLFLCCAPCTVAQSIDVDVDKAVYANGDTINGWITVTIPDDSYQLPTFRLYACDMYGTNCTTPTGLRATMTGEPHKSELGGTYRYFQEFRLILPSDFVQQAGAFRFDPNGTATLSSQTFVIAPTPVPVPVSPASGAVNANGPVRLVWNRLFFRLLDTYEIQVADTLYFGRKNRIIVDSALTDTSIVLTNLKSGTTYYWHVRLQTIFGTWTDWSEPFEFSTPNVTDVDEAPAMPAVSWQPSPASGETTVRFTLASAGPVRLGVYDLTGRLVAMPFSGTLPAGDHVLPFNAGTLLPGVYMYRLDGADIRTSGLLPVAR